MIDYLLFGMGREEHSVYARTTDSEKLMRDIMKKKLEAMLVSADKNQFFQ